MRKSSGHLQLLTTVALVTALLGTPGTPHGHANPAFARSSEPTSPHLATRVAETSAIGEAMRRARQRRIVDYRIRARLIPAAKQIRGEMSLRLRNISEVPVEELRLHLYLNAFSGPDTLFMRSSGGTFRDARAVPGDRGWIKVTHVRVDGYPATHQRLHDGTVMRVALAKALAPARTVALRMAFVAQLPQLFARTGYAREFFMGAQWYPKLGFLRTDGTWHCPPFHANSEFFAPFGRYRVTLALPTRFIVGASGVLTARRVRGDLQQLQYTADPVHDFAFAAWPHFARAQLRHGSTQVRLLSVTGREGQRARLVATLNETLDRLASWFGPYPYTELTIIDVPAVARAARGMEYPTLLTAWMPSWAPRGAWMFDELLAHELTHQYLQGIVATNEADEPWLDEGLTTYVSGIVLDQIHGTDRSFVDFLGVRMGQRTKDAIFQLQRGPPLPVARAAAAYTSWDDYAATVYGRTAALFYSLDNLIGRDRMIAALASYVRKNAFAHPTGSDLRRAILTHTPSAKRAIVRQLLRGVLDEGHVLDYALSCDSHGIHVLRHGSLAVPVTVYWRNRDGSTASRELDGQANHSRIEAPQLASARLGPAGRLALDATPLNNRCASGAPTLGIAARATGWIQLLLQAVGP